MLSINGVMSFLYNKLGLYKKMDYNLYVLMVYFLFLEWLIVLYIVNDIINFVYCIYLVIFYKRYFYLLSRFFLV